MTKSILGYPFRLYKRLHKLNKGVKFRKELAKFVNLENIDSITFSKNSTVLTLNDKRKFYWDMKSDNSLLTIPSTGTFEAKDSKHIVELLSKGMTTFDCGANFGWYTTLMAKCVGESGHVHSFEPVSSVYQYLEKNISLNSLKNCVTLNNKALADENAEKIMQIPLRSGTGTAFSSFVKQTWGKFIEVPVQTLTLDAYIKERGISSVDFIKSDVEGAEMLVLMGMKGMLDGGARPLLMLEIVDKTLNKYGYQRRDVFEYLGNYGYSSYYINKYYEKIYINGDDIFESDNVFFECKRV